MDRASQIFFWASIVLLLVGFGDRLTIDRELIAGVAPGSFWKAAIAFIGLSLASGQLAQRRSG